MAVPWGFGTIIALFVARGLFIFFVARLPIQLQPLWLDALDRIFTIGLVAFVVIIFFKQRYYFRRLFSLKQVNLLKNVILGLALLIGINLFENFWSQYFLADLQIHPLVQQLKSTNQPLILIATFVIGGLLTPLAEELFYRGTVYPVFKRYLNKWAAILVAAAFFTIFHVQTFWIVEIFLIGIILTYLFERYNSLVPGIVVHSLLNSVRIMTIILFK